MDLAVRPNVDKYIDVIDLGHLNSVYLLGKDLEMSNSGIAKNHIIDGPSCRYIVTECNLVFTN